MRKKVDAVDYAAEQLHINSNDLRAALDRGRVQAEREARRRYDGAISYQAITSAFALYQSVRDGHVSRAIFGM